MSPMDTGGRAWFVALLVCTFVACLGVSYLDEDAFISFRVVDNAVNGYGLRWNVDERVQVYTNPLWVLALIPVHAVLRDIAPASWLLSAAVSTAAVGVVARRLVHEPLWLVLGFLFPLAASQAFVDYTNSGLENPMLYLGIALFAERATRQGPPDWLPLCAFAALSAVTRLDAFLLFAPTLGWWALQEGRRAPWGRIALGASPLVAWLGFATFYYGTPFPNPKYAKLNAGIPRFAYMEKGRVYLEDMAYNDTVTFLGLIAAFGVAGWLIAARRGRAESTVVTLLAGSALYSAYVVAVGGDFMAGRYWTSPFFLVVATLALWGPVRDPTRLAAFAGGLLFVRFGLQPMIEEKHVIEAREHGRFAIVRSHGLRLQRYNCGFYEALIGSRGPLRAHDWSKEGLAHRAAAEAAHAAEPGQNYVVVEGNVGKVPYFGGPGVTYIDRLGVADALIARLPDADGKFELIGHLERDIPAGYVEARETGSLEALDPRLQRWYATQRLVIAGDLFDPARLAAIVRMNLGTSDADLRDYVRGLREQE